MLRRRRNPVIFMAASGQGLNFSDTEVVSDPPTDDVVEETPEVDEAAWAQFSDDATIAREFFLPGDEGLALSQEDNLIWKDIFREGEWMMTPTLAGKVDKKLRIVNEGATDYTTGVISLAEIEQAFNDQAVPYVQIPLTDTPGQDHKEMARLNQGFVKKLKRVQGPDGKWRLQAGMHFTEPETLEKVKRGTYADVSAKVTPVLRSRDKKVFPAALRHVCITNTPFIDGMVPFGVSASDEQPSAVESYQLAERLNANDERLSLSWRRNQAQIALSEQLQLSNTYTAADIVGQHVVVNHTGVGELSWSVPYTLTTSSVALSDVSDWQVIPKPEDTTPPKTQTSSESSPPTRKSALQVARELRGLSLSQTETSTTGGSHMPRGIEEELAGLELSDDARSAFQRLIAQNRELAKASKAAAVDARIDELKGLGFADSPGALKVYRQVALADDEMPVIEFSDDDGTQHKPSAQELLDTFIGALTGGKQIAVQLSEQHTTSGNDNPPPAKDEAGETRSFEDRLAAAKSAIGAK